MTVDANWSSSRREGALAGAHAARCRAIAVWVLAGRAVVPGARGEDGRRRRRAQSRSSAGLADGDIVVLSPATRCATAACPRRAARPRRVLGTGEALTPWRSRSTSPWRT